MTLLFAVLLSSMAQAPAQTALQRPDLLEQISCAPIGLPAPPIGGMRVLGGYIHGRLMFATGDTVILNAGSAQGVQPGQQYFVRRSVRDSLTKQPKVGALYGIHTAGWITVVAARTDMSIATVTHACDGVLEGDYVEPFSPPAMPTSALTGAPDFDHPGHIMLADERRQMGYSGLVMLMDRGTEDGVRAGQALTIYRESLNGQGPIVDVGRATVLSVSPKSSVVRIDSSRDAVYLGDLVAIHRITP